MALRRAHIKKIIEGIVWSMLSIGVCIVLGSAVKQKENNTCKKVEISITGAYKNVFIDEKDVYNILNKISAQQITGTAVNEFQLYQMEAALEKNQWIKSAQVYIDNNEVLWIKIEEREPVARVFTIKGNSFYIDSSSSVIPLSEKFSARLPVFTGFRNDSTTFSKSDSALLKDVRTLSEFIMKDSFWMAQIEQVEMMKDNTFQMIPKIGSQVILFGTAENYRSKFANLFSFYKDVQSRVGWNKYSKINLQFAGQVVAVKRGVEEVKLDSLKALQIMQYILSYTQKQVNDSTVVQLTQSDDNVQQIIPLINGDEDLPEENASKTKEILGVPPLPNKASVILGRDSLAKRSISIKDKQVNKSDTSSKKNFIKQKTTHN